MSKMVHLLVDERMDYRSWDEDGAPIGPPPKEPWWGLMACGMRQLAPGHAYANDTATAVLHVTCPICKPYCEQFGTPLSQLSGRPGTDGYARFVAIAESWGYP